MEANLEVIVKGMGRTAEIDESIKGHFDELVKLDSRILECRVFIERTKKYLQGGNPYRVIINLKLHSAPNIVVKREPSGVIMRYPLYTTLSNAFTVARRKLIEKHEQQQQIRVRPQAEYGAVVSKIFREKGYGFLSTDSGRSIYFHRDCVVGDEFDIMEIGTGVWFIEREGEMGPWASTVRICVPAS